MGPRVLPIQAQKEALNLFRESAREFSKEHPGQPFVIQFSIQMSNGPLTDSEALSYLDKISRALGQFPEEEMAAFDLKCILVNALDGVWTETVQNKAQVQQELLENEMAAKKKLILPK